MRIAYNPITEAALTVAPNNNDITFDLKGLNIFVRGVKFKGTDTTYSVFKKHTSSSGGGYNGLVPVPSYTSTNVRFLREDGTWQIPSSQYTYSSLSNQDLDTLKTEGKWYYLGGGNTVTNGPSGINTGGELYVGRNASGYRYQKSILSNGQVWFRIWNSTSWSEWKRWYTDANTDSKVLQSNTTTSNFRPVILGYNNNADHNSISISVTQQVYTTTSIYAQPSTGSLWASKLYSGGKLVITEHQSLANYVTLNTTQTITGQKTFTNSINSSLSTNTYLEGNKGKVLINSTVSAGTYVMLFKGNSTNGYFTHGVYQSKYLLQYTAKTMVDAGTNSVTKSATLLDEFGNSLFPGTISVYVLESRAATGTKPLNITSTTLVTNLNSDMLDNVHLAGFGGTHGVVRSWRRGTYTSANQYFGNGNIVTIDPKGTGCISANDTILSLGDDDNRNTQLLFAYDRDGVYYRRITDSSSYGSWKQLAFTTDNVSSATKVKVTQHTTNNTNYPIVWVNQPNTDSVNGDLHKSWNHLYYNPSTHRITAGGFIKSGSSDSYVLLGGGNHKALSDFSMAHSHPYLQLQTISGTIDVSQLKDTRLYYTTSDGGSQDLVNSPFTNTFSMIQIANLINGDTDWRRSAIAFNPYGEIKVFNDRGTSGGDGVWYKIWHSGNFNPSDYSDSDHNHDSRYVNITGDTMTGDLFIKKSGRTDKVSLFQSATENEGGITLIDKEGQYNSLRLSKTTGLTWRDRKVWNEYNDGHNSGLDADTLDSHHASDFMLKTEEVTNNVTTITKTLNVTSSWMDTGIAGNNLATGTYIIQLFVNDSSSFYSTYHSGIMSWYKDNTNDSETDEIILHRAGHAYNKVIYLRTIQTTSGNGGMKLQIAASSGIGEAHTYTFKFKRVI